MYPLIFGLSTYKFFGILGIFTFIMITVVRFKENRDEYPLLVVKLITLTWISASGARLLYGFHHIEKDMTFLSTIFPVKGFGYALYGGLIAGILSIWIYAKLKKDSFLGLVDQITPGILLGIAVGRIGCLLGGCCFGKVFTGPWQLHYPNGSLVHHFQLEHKLIGYFSPPLGVHPTPLYEMVGIICIVIIGLVVEKRGSRFKGRIFLVSVCGFSLLRLVNLLFRADPSGDLPTNFYPMLYISLITIAFFYYLKLHNHRIK